MTPTKLIIGSRGSELALYQANFIRDILIRERSCSAEIRIIKTAGDRMDQLSFDKMEGKGFFTKELEEALLNREIDLAVHSLKDLMTTQPEGLKLGAVGYRADRREMLLIRKEYRTGDGVLPIKSSGIIGTSSARRKCQVAHINPSLTIRDLRGNVPTRIAKLRDKQYDAIILAAAGVKRLKLNLADLEVMLLEPDQFLPAPAQGILGIQIRSDDPGVDEIVCRLESPEAAVEVSLERGLLQKFNAGCSLPLGVYSRINGKDLQLHAVLGVRVGENWSGLKRISVSGIDPSEIVNRAFNSLNKGVARCV